MFFQPPFLVPKPSRASPGPNFWSGVQKWAPGPENQKDAHRKTMQKTGLGIPNGAIWCKLWPKTILGKPGPYLRGGKVQFVLYFTAFWSKNDFEAAPAAPAAPAEMVPASAAQSLPSTRAGGQDDGSEPTPSN